jgi:dihydrofolate reductase
VLAHAEEVVAELGTPWPYTVPAWVMTSRTLEPLPGADIRVASGDVGEVHAAMTEAAGGKDLWVVGGGDLAGQLADAGLLESGRSAGFTCARYRVDGPLLEDRPLAD